MQQKICKINANQVQELNKEGFIIKQVIKTEQKQQRKMVRGHIVDTSYDVYTVLAEKK